MDMKNCISIKMLKKSNEREMQSSEFSVAKAHPKNDKVRWNTTDACKAEEGFHGHAPSGACH